MDQETVAENTAPGTTDADNPHVRAVIRQAELELNQLLEEQANVAERIVKIKRTIIGLVTIFGDDVWDADLLCRIDRKRVPASGELPRHAAEYSRKPDDR
jgi:hypothetical protein